MWYTSIQIPIQHWYYTNVIEEYTPSEGIHGAILKAAVDQLTFSPFIIALFIYYNSCMNGKDAMRALKQVRRTFFTIYMTSIMVWPVILTCAFLFFDVNTAMVVNIVANLFWNIFLCFYDSRNQNKGLNIEAKRD